MVANTSGSIAPRSCSAVSSDAQAREQRVVARDRATEVHTDHAVVLHQHVVGGHVGHPATREPDHEDPPAPRDAATRAVEHVTTDRVVHDIGTVALGVLLHRVDEVVGAVVDRELGAELAAQRDLVVAAGGRDHACTGGPAELDRGGADAARARVHEEPLALGDRGAVVEREPAGAVVDEERGRGRERHRRWDRDDPFGGEPRPCSARAPNVGGGEGRDPVARCQRRARRRRP